MLNVFLSASVPLPSRDPRFYRTADVIGIREAVKALIEVVLPRGRITTGGHPAITPLLALFTQESGLSRDRLTIYQSEYFRRRFPGANDAFADVRVVPEVGEKAESLRAMRVAMFESQRFDAGVFIGGMEGVLDEALLFGQTHPNATVLPVASTGAAAAEVFGMDQYAEDFKNQLTYPTLFRRHLPRAD